MAIILSTQPSFGRLTALFLLCFFCVFCGSPGWVAAATAIIEVELAKLNFGVMTVDSIGGTVTLTPGGAITAPANIDLEGGHVAGSYSVFADRYTAVSVSFDSTSTMTSGSGGGSVTIENFVASPNPVSMGALQRRIFYVGADLVIPSNLSGSMDFTGTYTITIDYN